MSEQLQPSHESKADKAIDLTFANDFVQQYVASILLKP
jgi:hypothetical protein